LSLFFTHLSRDSRLGQRIDHSLLIKVIELGRVFGHSTVSQCARAGSAARESLLTWIGPLSSTGTTGLIRRPDMGPWSRSSCSRCATKLVPSLVGVDDELARDGIERTQHDHFFWPVRRPARAARPLTSPRHAQCHRTLHRLRPPRGCAPSPLGTPRVL
jgi:hypothetical protein